ncbi:MAG: serine hydrolase, partial [Cytophagia bacterium]|nr:serine hydrolase [Cytophagia bacterium]
MKPHYLLLSFLLIFSSCQPKENESAWLSPTDPPTQGFSQSFENSFDSYIQKAVSDTVIPGGTFLIARNGHIVYEKSFGEIAGRPFKNDDLYRLASMTKAVTSVAMMQLVEQGKVNLDAPVYEYIPAFKNQIVLDEFNPADSSYTTVPVEKPVTIRNLMTHTSGIVYGSFNPENLLLFMRN